MTRIRDFLRDVWADIKIFLKITINNYFLWGLFWVHFGDILGPFGSLGEVHGTGPEMSTKCLDLGVPLGSIVGPFSFRNHYFCSVKNIIPLFVDFLRHFGSILDPF